jgi:uncharacterized membrane protein YhiD involved in acid resistance
MLQDFQYINLHRTDPGDVVGALVVAFVCGLVISLVYRGSYRGASYSASFVRSMIFLAMITAVVMLVIGNNLARAFGLVGAMSIIRFRTAVKDPQDIVFIFFALAAGLAAGVGLYMVALVGTAFIGLVILATTRAGYAEVHRQSFLLQLAYDDPAQNGAAAPYLAVLDRYCKKHRLINVRSAGPGDALELTFFVDLRRRDQREALTRELSALPHVRNVNLYHDAEAA